MPIDSDPDGPAQDRETPAAPDRQAGPYDPDRPQEKASPEGPEGPEGRAGREPRDRATSPDDPAFRQRQLAEHLRYRHLVDAADQAAQARQAWAQAVPDLRAAWEEHKLSYPERSRAAPLTRPDGSWVADGGRRLSPEQNAEAAKACADLRDEAGTFILPAMRRVEAASPDGQLAGLEHMLKGEDRLKEKIADAMQAPGITVSEAIDLVPDAVRFTLNYDAGRYADGVLADVDRLKAEGFELLKLKNLWHADQYKGVNSQWRRPDTDLRFEMQFHTSESLEAKELTHEAYERIRRQTVTSTEKLELEEFQRRVNTLLVTPPGTDRVKDFPEQTNDTQNHLLRNDRRTY